MNAILIVVMGLLLLFVLPLWKGDPINGRTSWWRRKLFRK
jgi:hypothetical protein